MSDIPTLIDILIVDDVPDNLRLLSRMLVRRGYEIWTAKSGPEALEFLEQSRTDLILLDINMPGMDGYEVCQHIKGTPALEEIPVIFLSALSEPSDKLRGFEVGGVDYVTKPFHFHEVIARVETHLELYRQKQENRRLREKERDKFSQISALKDQVLNTATHDLKNPLTSIKLSVTLLHRMLQNADAKVYRYLQKIEFDTDRMLSLITDLVDLAAVNVNSATESKTTDVNQFVRRSVNELSVRLQQNSIHVDLQGPGSELTAVFDAAQLSGVLQNLLNNLIKYTPQNGTFVLSYGVEGDWLFFRSELNQEGDDLSLDNKELNNMKLGFALLGVIVEEHGGKINRPAEDSVGFELLLPYRSAADLGGDAAQPPKKMIETTPSTV